MSLSSLFATKVCVGASYYKNVAKRSKNLPTVLHYEQKNIF